MLSVKKLLGNAADEAAAIQHKETSAPEAANLKLRKTNDMPEAQFSPAEVTKLRNKRKPVNTLFSANVGEQMPNQVMAEFAKICK